MDKTLKIGIPDGSLIDPNRGGLKELLDRARIYTRNLGTNMPPEIPYIPWLTAIVGRPQELPAYADKGHIDVFFCGDDWAKEWRLQGAEIEKMLGLKTGEVGIVLATKGGTLDNMELVRIASEYPYIARRYLSDKYRIPEAEIPIIGVKDLPPIAVEAGKVVAEQVPLEKRIVVLKSAGKTEAKVLYDIADAVVEATQSGDTLRNYGLQITATVLKSECSLYRSNGIGNDAWKMEKADRIRMMLEGVLNAYGKDLVIFNVPNERLDGVLDYIRQNRLFADEETIKRGSKMDEITLEIRTDDPNRPYIDIIGDLADLGAKAIEGVPLSYSVRGKNSYERPI